MIKVVKEEIKVVTGRVRFAYVSIFEPSVGLEGEGPRYKVRALIPKVDVDTVDKINLAVENAMRAGAAIWGGSIPGDLKLPLRDGDLEKPEQAEYAGHYFINCSSKIKPGIIDKNKKKIVDENEVYSGCYGRVSINFYPFNKAGKRGVGCGLLNVLRLEDGEHLGRSRAEDDFADEEDVLG